MRTSIMKKKAIFFSGTLEIFPLLQIMRNIKTDLNVVTQRQSHLAGRFEKVLGDFQCFKMSEDILAVWQSMEKIGSE
jgi:hypothetical protein